MDQEIEEVDSNNHPVYWDGRVHVQKKMCSTCIFRPGNLMNLVEGRVEGMIEDATAMDGSIPCHQTLELEGSAVCHGFFTKHKTQTLQIAERLGVVEFVQLSEHDHE